jgi:hypothetical protein
MKATHVVCAAALLLLACKMDGPKGEAAPPGVGKPQAPVAIDAEVGASSARVHVRFVQAGTGVEVRANGVDGLTPVGNTLLVAGRDVAAGEAITVDVPFTPGPGQSLLAIHVRGTFAAGERTAVRAFPVGKPSAEQRKAQEGTTRVGGEDVKLVPAEEQKK